MELASPSARKNHLRLARFVRQGWSLFQAYVTPFRFALVVLVQILCLAVLAAVLRTPSSRQPGWRQVSASGMHWLGFAGNWALTLLISWVWLFVGSGRRDAEEQMRYAFALILAFGLGAILCGTYIAGLRHTALRWQGTTIRWRKKGADMVQDMTQFDAIRRAWDGALQLRFRDGTLLKLDPYAQNAQEMLQAISALVPPKPE